MPSLYSGPPGRLTRPWPVRIVAVVGLVFVAVMVAYAPDAATQTCFEDRNGTLVTVPCPEITPAPTPPPTPPPTTAAPPPPVTPVPTSPPTTAAVTSPPATAAPTAAPTTARRPAPTVRRTTAPPRVVATAPPPTTSTTTTTTTTAPTTTRAATTTTVATTTTAAPATTTTTEAAVVADADPTPRRATVGVETDGDLAPADSLGLPDPAQADSFELPVFLVLAALNLGAIVATMVFWRRART